MTLLYPLGLLGLVAIPLLILIYIIKNKYTEQVIPSTRIWELSEKFLKHRNPVSRLAGIISLILQILAVILISFAVAHPVFTLKGQAEDYCFILDCSGSMNFESGESTRFDMAKNYVKKVVSSSVAGSTYTLIEAGSTTDAVFKKSDSKDSSLMVLDGVKCSHSANDLSDALLLAQGYFDDNPALKIYLLTDKHVGEKQNVEVVEFATAAKNCALSDAEYIFGSRGVTVTAKVISYSGEATVTVNIYEDEKRDPVASKPVSLAANEFAQAEITYESSGFSSLRVEIAEDDDLPEDNGVTLYNSRHDSTYNTLIVSDKPYFMETALEVFGSLQKDVIGTEEYDDSYSTGYGLYIFDGFSPANVPSDGAVWFINPKGTTTGAGFNVNSTEELEVASAITYSKSSSAKIRTLLSDCDRNEVITLKNYVRCNLYRSFSTVLSCDGNPVLFVGSNVYGNREAVFAFDTGWSDFVLSCNYLVLINNLLSYTFPSVTDRTLYYCGDTAQINVLSGCTSLRVEAPDGKYEYLDTSSEVSECLLSSAGEYKIVAVIGNEIRNIYIYSQLPSAERETVASLSEFKITGEASREKRDGRYEDILYLFIVLAVIVVADWAVYCYEQYQLR